jgi:RsmE family RNA methyltransferase
MAYTFDVNLIILHGPELDPAGQARIGGRRAAHLLTELKVTPGQTVRVGLLDGRLGTGSVTSADDGAVTLRCVFEDATPPRPRVDLLLALPRPKVMRRLWAQLAALGVGQIVLTNAARVERNYFDTHVLDEAFYRPLLIEGLQQARDTRLPAVSVHRQFKVLVEDHLDDLCGNGLRLAADHRAKSSLADSARHHEGRRVLLAIGPEGGWNEFELNLLQDHGFTPAALGPRPLRVDTACVALLAVVHDAIRDR